MLDQADPSTIFGGSWKITLFKDTRSCEVCVGFEGVRPGSVRNAAASFFHHLADPKGLLKDMGEIADGWLKKFKLKYIWSFVGHSEGGFLATHVKKGWDTFRVTFNAHKAERGMKNINLRLHGDIVSTGPLSVEDRYITLDGGEGHSLKSFEEPLRGKEWADLDAKRFSRPKAML